MGFKEDCLKLYRHEKIDYIPNTLLHQNFLPLDIVEHGPPMFHDGDISVDNFGVKWTLHGMGAIPVPGEHRLTDINSFEKEGVIPSDEFVDALPWEQYVEMFSRMWDKEDKFVQVLLPAGPFERLHHLRGMEEAMIALVEEPDAVKAFNKEMVRYKKRVLYNIKKYADADVVCCMDDYGSGKNLLMSRDMWLEFYYEPLKELADWSHELGMFYEHHSCGYITSILGDIIRAGADAINPVQGINDIDLIAKEYAGKILICGGEDSHRLTALDVTVEESEQIVRKVCKKLAPTGCWLPTWMNMGVPMERNQEIVQLYVKVLSEMGYHCQ